MIQNDLDNISGHLIEVASKAGRPDLADQLRVFRYPLQEERLAMAVIGEFGRGKTTLLNTLLGQELLPTGGFPMDSSYLVVTKGEAAAAEVHYVNGKKAAVEPTAEALSALEHPGELQVERIEIEAPLGIFPEGTCVLESPGLGDINPAHKKITEAILAQASAVIFVVDASLLLSQVEQACLQQLPGHVQRLLVVISKIDLLNPTEQDAVVAFVAEQVNKLELQVKPEIFALSARQVLEDQRTGKEIDSTAGDWLQLTQAIQRLAETQTRVETTSIRLYQLRRVADELAEILQTGEIPMGETPILPDTREEAARIARRRDDLVRSQELLIRVIEDQCADIMQTVKDGFETKAYFLDQGLKAGKLRPADVERNLRQWVREEEQRAYARLLKLFQSALEEILHLTQQVADSQPDVPSVRVAVPMTTAPAPISARARTLGAVGSGAIAAAASRLIVFSRGGLGLLASVSVGGLAGLAIWTILRQFGESPIAGQYLDEAGVIILKGFEDNIQRNTKRLKGLVFEHLEAAVALLETRGAAESVKPKTSAQQHLLAELAAIRRDLDNLEDEP